MKKSLISLALLLPLPVVASTLYKCTDQSGVILYTNQKTGNKSCTVLSVQVPPAPRKSADSDGVRPLRASATPTPRDFPRVTHDEQKSRDTDRRAILERELNTELASLEKAKQALGSNPAQAAQISRDTVTLHERNVEALNKELSKLR